MSFVDERTGTTPSLTSTNNICSHTFILYVIMSAVCVGGRLDLVFLVPASTDRISIADALSNLLISAAGSLNTIGARDSQVLVLLHCTFWWSAAHIFIISLFFFFQVGVVAYGYRPKIWFLLNSHDRSDTLLQKIQSTPFDETPGNNIGQILEIYISVFGNNEPHHCVFFLSMYFYVSLHRWSSDLRYPVPPDPCRWKKAHGSRCCRHHRR